jgi:protein-disulfide isomerase
LHWGLAILVSRRVVIAMLLLTGLAALAHFSPLRPITDVMVQNAADATRPVSPPDMALGPADAKVTITEYASPTCPHCADFNAKVFSEDQGGLHRYRQSALRVPRVPA